LARAAELSKTTLKVNKIKFNSYQKAAVKLVSEFKSRGFETYWVGGAVRDLLLKRQNFDIDMATAAIPSKTKKILSQLGMHFFTVGEKFGTIVTEIRGRKIEITSFRSEQNYKDSRHPSMVRFGIKPAEDVRRRDFTINALLFDPTENELIDHVGGLKDLKARRLKFVGNAATRIKEDPLRSLRAVRFATILNFKIAQNDFNQIKKQATLINKISGERIKQEIDKLLDSDNFIVGLKLLDSSGLLGQIFPELEQLKTVKQSKNYHAEGNVFKHSFLVLENLRGADLDLRWAALLHDIGKFGSAKKTLKEGRRHISFHGHAQIGAEMFLKIARRLHFSKQQAQKIFYLINRHMDLRPIENIQEKTLIRWAKEPWFIDLLKLRIADSLGAKQTDLFGRVVKKEMRDWFAVFPKIKRWQKVKSKKIVDGADVMKILKLEPSKKVGEILEEVEILQKQGKIKNRQQGITFIKSLDSQSG